MHNYFEILLHYKRAVISAFVSVSVPLSESALSTSIDQLTQIDMWMGILAKLVGAIAGLYTIYEIRRKKHADELKRQAATARDRSLHQGQNRSVDQPNHPKKDI
ncbi:hypothetical protein [Roseivirga seohaensis]|uniref:hypothetical protein n=1 Tax=Roseivirga seohaensis TaxID=1914963 RepID=UPI003BABBD66